MDPAIPVAVYTDGGVVAPNPSPYAATWGWCAVNALGTRVAKGSGILIAPSDESFKGKLLTGTSVELWPGTVMLPKVVSNNHAEIAAVVHALEAMPEGWSGEVRADSRVALAWLVASTVREVILPLDWWMRLQRAKRRLGELVPVQCKGHVTNRKWLDRGTDPKGRHVSAHNTYVDWLCNEEKKRYDLFRVRLG